MTASAPVSAAEGPRADNSPLAVMAVFAALALVLAAVLFVWGQVVPRPPLAIEHYLPLTHGAAFTYRLTNADGSVTYRARNIYRARASAYVSTLDTPSFTALIKASGVDVSAGAEQALATLAHMDVADITDVEYDSSGKTLNRTHSLALLSGDTLMQFAINGAGIDPGIPLMVQEPASVTGAVGENLPYSATVQIEARLPVETNIGAFPDCIRLRQQLLLNAQPYDSLTTYCVGVGEVSDETLEPGASAPRRSEIVAASIGDLVRGSAPVVPATSPPAELEHVFAAPPGGALVQQFQYTERSESRGISTNILPVEGMLLYGTSSGALVALDRASEKELWRFQTGNAVYSTPVVANGLAFFGSADKKVYAVRAADGAFVWSFLTRDIVSASPAVDGSTVYVASEDRRLYALDADTGRPRWQITTSGPLAAPPVVRNQVVYASNDDGVLDARDASTGASLWSWQAGDAITAPVTLDGELVYVTSFDEHVYALRQKDGSVVWSENLQDYMDSPAVVAGRRVIVALPTDVFALDAATGARLWHYHSDRTFKGAPVVLGDRAYILRAVDIVALALDSGAVVSQTPTSYNSLVAGLSSNGHEIYAGYFDGTLLGFAGGGP